jgi:hypothetical protein
MKLPALKPARTLGLICALAQFTATGWASQTDIVGPPGSGAFGTAVVVLPNGNIVVTDPFYDALGIQDVGAVFLYSPPERSSARSRVAPWMTRWATRA